MRGLQEKKGITLIALIVTIILLLILAGMSIAMVNGNGLFSKAKESANEYQKSAATEKLKMKMAECQMECITEKGEYPTLAYLAAFLQDEKIKNGEIEYVEATSRSVASLDETPYVEWDKIYTKFEKYPFEFEIDSDFKVSVNGQEVAVPSGYMRIPTETLNITENGEHDVTDYAKVNVNVTGISSCSIQISQAGVLSIQNLSDVRSYSIFNNNLLRIKT